MTKTSYGERRATAVFGYPVSGIGASYQRSSDHWVIYTMPDTKPFATVAGYHRGRLGWVVDALRASIVQPDSTSGSPWVLHLDYAGEPMQEGESRDPEGASDEGALREAALAFVAQVQQTLLANDAILVDFPLDNLGRLLALLKPWETVGDPPTRAQRDGSGPPEGYVPMPRGHRCKCLNAWLDESGSHWCCAPAGRPA